MNKLAYIKYSQKEANQKIWNSLMAKYELAKKKNTALAYLWFPAACIIFGFVAVASWLSFFALLFKDVRFTPHYLRTVIEHNKMDKEKEKEYIDTQFLEYKNRVSYGNISTKNQNRINATFDLLYRRNEEKQGESKPLPKTEPVNKDFKSTLNEEQLKILVECINKIQVLEANVNTESIQQILSCSLKEPLKIASKKNKLLVYLFTELSNNYYIVREWQAVCAQNKIFLSSEKGIPLSQDNISTTVNINLESPPKDSHIIDKYLKKLQEH